MNININIEELPKMPKIYIKHMYCDLINSSLDEVYLSLTDHNEELMLTYPGDDDGYNDDYDSIYDEDEGEKLSGISEMKEYIDNATIITADAVNRVLTSMKNCKILAFFIPESDDRILFFIKKNDEEENFRALILLHDYEINLQLFMNKVLNLGQFRYYGSGIYGFYMQDILTEYNFEVIKYKNDQFMSKEFLKRIEPVLGERKRINSCYFVVKNNAGDPIIMTRLTDHNIKNFTETITKADPQAGLLFSLSYNTNK